MSDTDTKLWRKGHRCVTNRSFALLAGNGLRQLAQWLTHVITTMK